jgi:hypothetical protein
MTGRGGETRRPGRCTCALGLAAATVIGALGLAPATARATVKEFPQPQRHLKGFWANENVPPYQCPTSHPYLQGEKYQKVFTTLIPGVSIDERGLPWPIGVSITGATTTGNAYMRIATGISDKGGETSATNWTGNDEWYQVVLHCTDNPLEGYTPSLMGGDGR